MSKQHMKLSVGVLVIVASVAYLIVSGATGKTMYFLTVPEVQQQLTTLTGCTSPCGWQGHGRSCGVGCTPFVTGFCHG
jgi:hypothetical protein